MTFGSFVAQHWFPILVVVGYVALTCANQLPEKWTGFYPYFYNVVHSLAASPPAQRFEAKYNVTTTPEGTTSKTQTVSSETPKT